MGASFSFFGHCWLLCIVLLSVGYFVLCCCLLVTLYCAVVCYKLEFMYVVWNNVTLRGSAEIERVQRKFTACATIYLLLVLQYIYCLCYNIFTACATIYLLLVLQYIYCLCYNIFSINFGTDKYDKILAMLHLTASLKAEAPRCPVPY
jgi:hypothetical protein